MFLRGARAVGRIMIWKWLQWNSQRQIIILPGYEVGQFWHDGHFYCFSKCSSSCCAVIHGNDGCQVICDFFHCWFQAFITPHVIIKIIYKISVKAILVIILIPVTQHSRIYENKKAAAVMIMSCDSQVSHICSNNASTFFTCIFQDNMSLFLQINTRNMIISHH